MFKAVHVSFEPYRRVSPRQITRDGIRPSASAVGLAVSVTAASSSIEWVNVVFARKVYRRMSESDGGPVVVSGNYSQTIKFEKIGPGETRSDNLPISDVSMGTFGAMATFSAESLIAGLVPYQVYGQFEDGRTFEEIIGRRRDLKMGVSTPNCFVATAAFEGQNHPTVRELRLARDEILARTRSGRRLIDFYYRHGPKLDRVVEGSRALRVVFRGGRCDLWHVAREL